MGVLEAAIVLALVGMCGAGAAFIIHVFAERRKLRIAGQIIDDREIVLRVMTKEWTPGWGAYELSRETGLRSGRLYPALAHMEQLGWVVGDHDLLDPPDKPRRRYYRLTKKGKEAARNALQA